MSKVQADDLPDLNSFVAGLRQDTQAVTNGLTLPYSSGAVEGAVNRIKMLKRQMFGRAKLPLLRKRILRNSPAAPTATRSTCAASSGRCAARGWSTRAPA